MKLRRRQARTLSLGTPLISAPLVNDYYISLFTCFRGCRIRQHDARRTDAVSHHRINVSNCSALLSRDHTAALAHASSRTERRSFDELTRTVNHSGGGGSEGLASSTTGTAERARTRPSGPGPARTCTSRRGSGSDGSRTPEWSRRTTTLRCLRASSRGVA